MSAPCLVLAGFNVLTFRSLSHDLEAAAANKRPVMIVSISALDRAPLRALQRLALRAGRAIKTIALLDARTQPHEAIEVGACEAFARDVSRKDLIARVTSWGLIAERERRYLRALAELSERNARQAARLRRLARDLE